MMPEYKSDWAIGAHCHIDGDATITAIVTGLEWSDAHTIHVEWFSNGELKDKWLPPWRLTRCRQYQPVIAEEFVTQVSEIRA